MNIGAFAILDCLGFKGVWRSNKFKPQDLANFLLETKTNARGNNQVVGAVKQIFGEDVILDVSFVSDTVVVSARYARPPERNNDHHLVVVVLSVCCEVQKKFLRAPTPLALRGCIAFGEHLVVDNFYLGPAVDEAASLAETSQGAFVWLTPEACAALDRIDPAFASAIQNVATQPAPVKVPAADELMRRLLIGMLDHPSAERIRARWFTATAEQKVRAFDPLARLLSLITKHNLPAFHDYPMPLRTGGVLKVSVMNPFIMCLRHEFSNIYRLMLASFDASSVDVLLKRQHTDALMRTLMTDAATRHAKKDGEGDSSVAESREIFPGLS